MAITKLVPNTIHLAGPMTLVNDIPASATITPGMLVELHDNSGVNNWRANGSDTEIPTIAVALEQEELNKKITDNYAALDLVKVGFLAPGSIFFGIIPSGQTISNGELLQSNGDGKLKTASASTAAASVAKFQSLDNPGAVAADTRLRVQVIQ